MLLEKSRPDLVLLDLMLPGLSGEELLPKLRGVPVIVLSAKADVDHKAQLLLDGAADYVTKPFALKELLARVAAQLRIHENSGQSDILTFEALRMDTAARQVTVSGKEVRLTPTEYAILKLLLENSTRAVAKSVMLDRLAMETPDCTESSLKIHVSNLRKKLRESGGRDYIDTVWGIGFQLSQTEAKK